MLEVKNSRLRKLPGKSIVSSMFSHYNLISCIFLKWPNFTKWLSWGRFSLHCSGTPHLVLHPLQEKWSRIPAQTPRDMCWASSIHTLTALPEASCSPQPQTCSAFPRNPLFSCEYYSHGRPHQRQGNPDRVMSVPPNTRLALDATLDIVGLSPGIASQHVSPDQCPLYSAINQ